MQINSLNTRIYLQVGITILILTLVTISIYGFEQRTNISEWQSANGQSTPIINTMEAPLLVFIIAISTMIFQFVEILVIANLFRAKREAEANLKALQTSLTGGLFQIDINQKLTYVSPAGEKLFGYSFAELKDRNLYELIEPNEQKSVLCPPETSPILNVLKTGIIHHEPIKYFEKKDGIVIPVEYTCAPIIDKDRILGAVICMQDVSQRTELERRVSEFHSTVSHELRTPLTSIRGTLSLMDGGRLGILPDKAKNLAKIALSESERLIELVNGILDIGRIESGKLELKYEQTSASKIIHDAFANLSRISENKSMHLIADVITDININCDPNRIKQVLSNLISNAIKFSPTDSDIIVKAENKGHSIRFSVKDNGVGIDQDQLPKLFGLFQQLDSSDSRPNGGAGLGLSLCKAIIENHGGQIDVLSDIGKGSTFWFEIPFNSPQQFIQKMHRTAALDEMRPPSHKVLLVEDDSHLSTILKEALESEQFIVITSSTLKEARAHLEARNIPHVILLDILLPDGNGFDLLPLLRQNTKTENIPVVVITGSDSYNGDYSDPLLIDWIKKPFDMERLFSALEMAMKCRPPGKARVLLADDDQATRELIKQQLKIFDVEYIEAEDGISAIYEARAKNPDLIILDLAIPSADGFEIVKILRREKNRSTSLLVYTARDLTNDDKQKLTLGLSAYLTKSCTPEDQFIGTVKSLLNGLITNGQKSQPTKTTGHPLS